MQILWVLWTLCATMHLMTVGNSAVARRRAVDAVLRKPVDQLTLCDLRVLRSGDSRDPIERHQDAMTSQYKVAALVISAGVLFTVKAL